jgi:transcription antitermination factor NusG
MPLLAAEPSQFPASLFDLAINAGSQEERWWVLHTRPRQEKALARHLLQLKVPFYLPVVPRRSRIRGRLMTSHLPLFPGYLFLHANREQKTVALTTNRVASALAVADQIRIWNDLRQVYQLIASGQPITPEDRLAPGVLVEIRQGPLTGMKGKILRAASGFRFVVEVDFIQRGASVTLDDHCLTVAV